MKTTRYLSFFLLFALLGLVVGCQSAAHPNPATEPQFSTSVPTNSPATFTPPPTPTPTEEAALQVGFISAIQQNLIVITSAQGSGIDELDISLQSKSEQPLEIAVLPGITFTPDDPSVQAMITSQSTTVLLGAGQEIHVTLDVACAEMRKEVPTSHDTFTLGNNQNIESDLKVLLQSSEFANQDFVTQQYAIWTITEKPGATYHYVTLTVNGQPTPQDSQTIARIGAMFIAIGIDIQNYGILLASQYETLSTTSYTEGGTVRVEPRYLALSPDGSLLAMADWMVVQLWNSKDLSIIGSIHVQDVEVIEYIQFSPDGNLLGILGRGNGRGEISMDHYTFGLWDLKSKAFLNILPVCGNKAVFSMRANRLALDSCDTDIIIYDIATGKEVSRIAPLVNVKILEGRIEVALSDDGKVLALSDSEGHVSIWDVGAGTLLKSNLIYPDFSGSIYFSLSPGGEELFYRSKSKTVSMWIIDKGPNAIFKIRVRDITDYGIFSPDNKYLLINMWSLTTMDEGTLVLFKVKDGSLVAKYQYTGKLLTNPVFSPDGSSILYYTKTGFGEWPLSDLPK